jgi:hypothetical protein
VVCQCTGSLGSTHRWKYLRGTRVQCEQSTGVSRRRSQQYTPHSLLTAHVLEERFLVLSEHDLHWGVHQSGSHLHVLSCLCHEHTQNQSFTHTPHTQHTPHSPHSRTRGVRHHVLLHHQGHHLRGRLLNRRALLLGHIAPLARIMAVTHTTYTHTHG